MKSKKIVKLYFVHPTDKPLNLKDGKYGDPRPNGRTHKGIDYLAPKDTDVRASEKGIVVKSENKAYVPWSKDNNYGETIVIDHTPFLAEKERHVYTLYAHLGRRCVFVGKEVEQGDIIGKSGNSGMKAAYEGKNRGFHLHFEVRDTSDSKQKLNWAGWQRDYYRNPHGYIEQITTIEFETDEEYAVVENTSPEKLRNPFAPGIPMRDW